MYGCKNVEEKVSQMNENKRVTSIARKINISFWLKEVGNVIGINIIIALLIMGTWMYWCTTKLPDQVTVSIIILMSIKKSIHWNM